MNKKKLVKVRIGRHLHIGELICKGDPQKFGSKAPYDYVNTLRPAKKGGYRGYCTTGPITALTAEQVESAEPFDLDAYIDQILKTYHR